MAGRTRRERDSDPARKGGVVFIDSSAWIAFFSASDGRHREADAGFRDLYARDWRMLTTPLVLAEVHRFLLFRAGIRPARLALERVYGIPRLTVIYPAEQHEHAARSWLDRLADRAVTYADAMSFAVMEGQRCRDAFTFDSDFSAAGFAVWPDPTR